MQVVGSSLVLDAVRAVARRAQREDVRAWAERVIFRHIKRTRSLMARVDTQSKLDQVLAVERLPPDAVERICEAFEAGDEFFAPSASLVTAFLHRASDTMDFICSLPNDDRRIRRIERVSWADAEAMSEAWHAAIARAGSRSRNLIAGTSRIMEYEDGVHVAELLTAKALAAEGSTMGHCVGGYWRRVQSGDTRIVSVRDRNAQPHVTIELGRPPRLCLEDGTELNVDREPSLGRDELAEVAGEWMAVQIRGKQNKPPVEKWQSFVDRYLSDMRMVWSEFGRTLGGRGTGRRIVTYRAGDAVGLDPDAVAARVESGFLSAASAQNDVFGDMYRLSGLEEVHRHCVDAERLERQAEAYLPLAMGCLAAQVDRGVPFRRAVGRSAMPSVLKLISGGSRTAESARRKILDLAISKDAQQASVASRPLLAMPGQKPLMHYRHEIPLMTVALLSMDVLQGMEDEVAELIRPSLLSALSHARSEPQAIHTFAAAVGGLEPEDVVKACLLSGLAAEYASAVAAVDAGVRAKVRELRLAAKRDRVKVAADIPALNLVSNLLSDGYEERLRKLTSAGGKGGLVMAPAPVRTERMRIDREPDPAIKKYRLPGR
jgi:hypothetical protein